MSEHPAQQPPYQQQQQQQQGAPWPGPQVAYPPQHVQQAPFKPLPDLARGYLSLRSFAQPVFGIVFPCVGLFVIGAYGIALAALSGLVGVSLMTALIGWLCMAGGVATSTLIVRRMVKNFLAAGSYIAALLWIGLVLPSIGFVLITIAPLMTQYPAAGISVNGLPMIGLFIVCVILVPVTGLSQAMSVRRVERTYGTAGASALWALQQGQLANEHAHL
uniref:hypothetical protein n=1 Tax=Leucobacter sp. BZR 635 TaxID=3378705 RepID=UPI003A89E218